MLSVAEIRFPSNHGNTKILQSLCCNTRWRHKVVPFPRLTFKTSLNGNSSSNSGNSCSSSKGRTSNKVRTVSKVLTKFRCCLEGQQLKLEALNKNFNEKKITRDKIPGWNLSRKKDRKRIKKLMKVKMSMLRFLRIHLNKVILFLALIKLTHVNNLLIVCLMVGDYIKVSSIFLLYLVVNLKSCLNY